MFCLKPKVFQNAVLQPFAEFPAAAMLRQHRRHLAAADQKVAAFGRLEGATLLGEEPSGLAAVHAGIIATQVLSVNRNVVGGQAPGCKFKPQPRLGRSSVSNCPPILDKNKNLGI